MAGNGAQNTTGPKLNGQAYPIDGGVLVT